MQIDLLTAVRDNIDLDNAELQEREVASYDQAVLAAAPDVFRQLKPHIVVLVYLYLTRHPDWAAVVENSKFRLVLELALDADPTARAVSADLRAGRRLTVAMLRQHEWPYLPGKANDAIDAAGGMFQMQILLHDMLRPWVAEMLPGFREEFTDRLGPDKVSDLWDQPNAASYDLAPEQAPDDLSRSVYGIYSASLENQLEGDKRQAMIRIRKERPPQPTQGTNADTIVFAKLTAAEEIEFCRSAESRRQIVTSKLRMAGEQI